MCTLSYVTNVQVILEFISCAPQYCGTDFSNCMEDSSLSFAKDCSICGWFVKVTFTKLQNKKSSSNRFVDLQGQNLGPS